MVRDIERRDFLKSASGAGVVGLTALAGCTGDGGDGTDGDGMDDGTDEGDGMDDGTDEGDGMDGGGRELSYGVLMPETGDLGSLGQIIRDGALLPARQLEGETDFTIDVETADTQTDPQVGISAAQNLVDAGYPAVVGSASSNVNLQVTRQVFIPNEAVGISPSSTAPAVTELDDDDYVYRTAPSDALQGPVIAQVAASNLDASTAGTLYLNDNYGQALEEAFVQAFEEEDGQAVNRVSFEPEQASYSSQIGEALNDNPDVLLVVGFPQSGITLFRDYYDGYASDYDVPIIVPDGLIDEGLPEEVGNPMNNVYGTAPAASGPSADTFAQLYEEEFDREPGVFNAHAYDAAATVLLANAAAGENDGTGVRDNMRTVANPEGTEVTADNLAEGLQMAADGEEVNYQGASSQVNFDDNGDMQAVSYDVLRFQDGEIETQETIDFEG